jgi:hypothetical protein
MGEHKIRDPYVADEGIAPEVGASLISERERRYPQAGFGRRMGASGQQQRE